MRAVLDQPSGITNPHRIDVAKALKLRMQGNTLTEIAAVFGVTGSAVHQALNKFEKLLGNLEPGTISAYAEERASVLNVVELQATMALSASLVDGRAEKSSPRDLAVALGVITDKRRLEAGQSTSNHSILGKFILDAESKLGGKQMDKQTDKQDPTLEK